MARGLLVGTRFLFVSSADGVRALIDGGARLKKTSMYRFIRYLAWIDEDKKVPWNISIAERTGSIAAFLTEIVLLNTKSSRKTSSFDSILSTLKSVMREVGLNSVFPDNDCVSLANLRTRIADHTLRAVSHKLPVPMLPLHQWAAANRSADLDLPSLRRKMVAILAFQALLRADDFSRITWNPLRFADSAGTPVATAAWSSAFRVLSFGLLGGKSDPERKGISTTLIATDEPECDAGVLLLQFIRILVGTSTLPVDGFLFGNHFNARADLKAVLDQVWPRGHSFTPHSFRTGGCSFLADKGVPMEVLMAMGHWRSPTTVASHYIATSARVSLFHS